MNKSAKLPKIPPSTGKLSSMACLFTTLLAVLTFAPMIWRMSASAYDYIVHTNHAIKMLADRSLPSPHFLLQAGIITIQQILPISFHTATALVVLISIAGTAALLFKIINTASGNVWISGFLTICLMLVAPIFLLAPLDGNQYFGYIGINVYHSPTILLLKPFALLVFVYIFPRTGEDAATSFKSLTVCALATSACALAKPSYIVAIVPALVIAACNPHMRKALTGRTWLILFGILLPALVILVGQYWITYSVEQLSGVYEGKSSIIIAPLAVVSKLSSWLLSKFFLSIAFPLAVCVGYFRQALATPRLLLAWLTFLIGASYTYLLAESGPRMLHGNFIWSSQITLFILFVISTEFLCEQICRDGLKSRSRKLVFALCVTFFIIHLLCGINFYLSGYIAGYFR